LSTVEVVLGLKTPEWSQTAPGIVKRSGVETMRADTRTVSIQAPPARVLEFVADVQNLPRWAVGFAKSVSQTPGGWVVRTERGELGIRVDVDRQRGTIDFWMSPGPGVDVLAASRVLPRGTGSELIFTQFQTAEMPDDVFARSVQTLVHELTVLKALMEVACPL
jgi:Polyketide cyclase / dehydrase and lipid transport